MGRRAGQRSVYASIGMTQQYFNITTGGGFREAVRILAEDLPTLSADDAAASLDALKGAAPRAVCQIAGEDLEDLRVQVDVLKGRVRRLAARQRSRGRNSTLVVSALAGLLAYSPKILSDPLPSWVLVAGIALGIAVAASSASSVSESTDWRENVLRPLDEVGALIARRLGEIEKEQGTDSYRRPASTRIDVGDTVSPVAGEESEPEAARTSNVRGLK